MYEFVVRNKWVVLAAVIVAFAGLQALVLRGDDADLASDNAPPSAEIQAAPPAAAIPAPRTTPDVEANDDQGFDSDDELNDDTDGDDPSPDVDDNQSGGDESLERPGYRPPSGVQDDGGQDDGGDSSDSGDN